MIRLWIHNSPFLPSQEVPINLSQNLQHGAPPPGTSSHSSNAVTTIDGQNDNADTAVAAFVSNPNTTVYFSERISLA